MGQKTGRGIEVGKQYHEQDSARRAQKTVEQSCTQPEEGQGDPGSKKRTGHGITSCVERRE
jgi:hypothetical protein